jgi:hypothetical protein
VRLLALAATALQRGSLIDVKAPEVVREPTVVVDGNRIDACRS